MRIIFLLIVLCFTGCAGVFRMQIPEDVIPAYLNTTPSSMPRQIGEILAVNDQEISAFTQPREAILVPGEHTIKIRFQELTSLPVAHYRTIGVQGVKGYFDPGENYRLVWSHKKEAPFGKNIINAKFVKY